MTQTIRAQGLTVYRSKKRVLNQLNFQLRVGQVVGVLGANAAGKSTLLSTMAGDLPVHEGQLWINEQPLCVLDTRDQARLRAVLPQQTSIHFDLTLREVVEMGAYPFPEASPEQLSQWVQASLEDCDLQHLHHRRYQQLSGGQQQRVQLARVLVQARAIIFYTGHAYILLDEPTSSLDPGHQQRLMKRLQAFSRSAQVGVLTIMHDLNLAARWCDRVILLKAGQILADAAPAQALTASLLQQTFDTTLQVIAHPMQSDRVLVLTAG